MKKLFLLCFLIGITSLTAFAQFFQWAKMQENSAPFSTPGFNNYSHINGGKYLANTNNILATTGLFYDDITLGNQTFTLSDSIDAYLALYDLHGNVLWAKQIISQTSVRPSVTIDPKQNVIISGVFRDSLYIDGRIFKASAANKMGVYTAKFSSNGTFLWAQSSDVTTGNYKSYFFEPSVLTDATGNVYFAGNFRDSLIFNNNVSLKATYNSQIFLVKVNENGIFQWATQIGNSTKDNYSINIQATAAGNIYVSNISSTLGQPGSGHLFTKLNSAGNIIWNKSLFMPGIINGINLTTDNSENIYLTGYFFSNITLGNTTLNTNTPSCFIAKMNAAGTWKWARPVATWLAPGSPPSIIFDTPEIAISADKHLAVSGPFSGTPQFAGSTLPVTSSAEGIFISQLDTAGYTVWVNTIMDTNQPTFAYPTSIIGDHSGNFYLQGTFKGSFQFGNTTLTSSPLAANFLTKIKSGFANAATGKVFIDTNRNGIYDAAESPFRQLVLNTSLGNVNVMSGQDGNYKLYLPGNNSTIKLAYTPLYYTAVPVSHNVSFMGMNQTVSGNDFALQPILNMNDVKVTATALTPARPGFKLSYRLTFQNIGTTVLSDTLQFTYNSNFLNYDSASIMPATTTNGKLRWYYLNLQPNETRNIDVIFSVPATTALGSTLQSTITINPIATDMNLSDNTRVVNTIVTGSFDPNDKQVDKTTLSPGVAANGEYLDYTIRFQNTGTDTAFTVIITDEINTKLDLAHFEMLSASHDYKLSLNDNNFLEWRFDNILLPDSNRNEPASHGFVRFRVKSNAGLVLGDSITNNAAIYFDYNAPIITNYAVTKVTDPLSVKENKETNIQAFRLYPNPAKNYVMVDATFKKKTTATVSLVNLLGQTISKVTLPANNQIHYQMPLSILPKGVYLIKLQTETGMQTQRLVIQ